MESLDVDVMLVQWCGAIRVEVVKSTMEHSLAKMRCFALKQFGEQMVIGCYSGTQISTHLFRYKDV